MMGLRLRCRYSSLLQVVAIGVCYRQEVTSKIAQGCVGSQLNLTCKEMKVIQITALDLGDSDCSGASCCIKDDDCTTSANARHRLNAHLACDNKQRCEIGVLPEKIPCGYFGWWSTNSDYERITYNCVDNPRYIAQGCVGSQLNLTCEEMKVIQIISVVLGDSYCYGSSCCINYNDCTRSANLNHRTVVHQTCDNEHVCTIGVLKEEITCGYRGGLSNNDFERITYTCINETNETMNLTAEQDSTEGDSDYEPEHFMEEGCVGSHLSLRCEEMKVINITAVIVGNSKGIESGCHIMYNNCTRFANENHTTDVHRRCNYQTNCAVDVFKEVTPCKFLFNSSSSGFERIIYDCLYDTQRTPASVPSRPDATDLSTTEYSPENKRTNVTMNPNTDKESMNGDHNPDHESGDNSRQETTTIQDNSRYLMSTDGTLMNPNNNKDAHNEGDQGPKTYVPNSEVPVLPVVVVIICLIILLAMVVLFVVYRRKQCAQVKLFHPVAMTEVGNQQNESNIYADDSQTTHENNVPLSVHLVDEDPPVYSEMVWKDDVSNSAAADEPNPAIQAHMTGPDVYTEVNKPSKTQATASALETGRVGGTGPVKTGDCLPDQIYSLASNDVGNIYANEPAADSKTSSLQDDDGQTLIENDLYSH